MIIKAVVVVWPMVVSLRCGCGCSQRVAAAAVPPLVDTVAAIVPPGVVAVLPFVSMLVALAEAAPSFDQRAETAIQGGGERRSKELYS